MTGCEQQFPIASQSLVGRADMMLLNIALLVCSLSLSSVNAECHRNGVPCLDYTVLHTYEGYEERAYPPIAWVSASAEATRKMDVSRSLIKLLYAYLAGSNDKGEKLQMVVPVRTKKVVNGDTNIYTMSIPLTPEKSENPPAPTNPNVTVSTEPRTVYIARSFGGRVLKDDIWDKQADILKSSVANDDSIDTSFYYMSVYDSPWRESDRLNEVWMVKRQE